MDSHAGSRPLPWAKFLSPPPMRPKSVHSKDNSVFAFAIRHSRWSFGSIGFPHARREKFHHVVVGIAEVEAASPSRPRDGTFDGDARGEKVRFPLPIAALRNSESEMQRAV